MANFKNYMQILEDNDLKFISFFKKNKRSYIIYECKKHGEQTQRFDGFKMCKVCSKEQVGQKVALITSESLESVKKWISENSDAEIMTKEYKNSTTNYWFRCKCGNGFFTSMKEFRQGNKRQCNLCGEKNRVNKVSYSFDTYFKRVESYNKSKLIKIIKRKNRVYFKLECCRCGKPYYMERGSYFKSPTKTCKKCTIDIKSARRCLTEDEVKEYLTSYGLTLLTPFKNTRSYIDVECKCGNVYTAKFNTIRNSKYKSCRECAIRFEAEKKALLGKDFSERFKKINSDDYELLTDRTIDTKFVEIKHKTCNGIYNVLYKTAMDHPTVCPYCNMTKGEDKIAYFLKNNNIDFIPQYQFENCKNIKPLRFDFYLPKYKILIEFDGELHYFVYNYTGLEKYMSQRKNDMIKNKFCRENKDLKLVRIPYFEYKNINKILKYLLMI